MLCVRTHKNHFDESILISKFNMPLITLRKHAYFNILKILQPNTENFQIKKSDIFHISTQNIDCGYSLEPPRRGGSNEYPQSIFLSRNKKNNVYLCKLQFYCIKVGFKWSKLYRHVFVMIEGIPKIFQFACWRYVFFRFFIQVNKYDTEGEKATEARGGIFYMFLVSPILYCTLLYQKSAYVSYYH